MQCTHRVFHQVFQSCTIMYCTDCLTSQWQQWKHTIVSSGSFPASYFKHHLNLKRVLPRCFSCLKSYVAQHGCVSRHCSKCDCRHKLVFDADEYQAEVKTEKLCTYSTYLSSATCVRCNQASQFCMYSKDAETQWLRLPVGCRSGDGNQFHAHPLQPEQWYCYSKTFIELTVTGINKFAQECKAKDCLFGRLCEECSQQVVSNGEMRDGDTEEPPFEVCELCPAQHLFCRDINCKYFGCNFCRICGRDNMCVNNWNVQLKCCTFCVYQCHKCKVEFVTTDKHTGCFQCRTDFCTRCSIENQSIHKKSNTAAGQCRNLFCDTHRRYYCPERCGGNGKRLYEELDYCDGCIDAKQLINLVKWTNTLYMNQCEQILLKAIAQLPEVLATLIANYMGIDESIDLDLMFELSCASCSTYTV